MGSNDKKDTIPCSDTEYKVGKVMKFSKDSVIIREGDVHEDMYKIVQGNVELYTGYGTDQEVFIGIIGPQACFGEFGILLHKPAIYTAVAFSDVYVLRITEGDMGDFVQENHKNIIDIMRNMAGTMLTMRTQIDLLIKEVRAGNTPDEETIMQAQRTIRGYAVYTPNNPTEHPEGKMRFIGTREK